MRSRLLVAAAVLLAFAAFFALGGHRYLTFDNLKAQQAAAQSWYQERPGQTAAGFFAVYVAATALSLPGAATLLTLAVGATFGLLWGTVLVFMGLRGLGQALWYPRLERRLA